MLFVLTQRSQGEIMKIKILVLLFLLMPFSVKADRIEDVTPELVMAGNSSTFSNGVWIRVGSLVGNQNCQYGIWTLFYANSDGTIDPGYVLSLATTAKLTGKKLIIEYVPDSATSDFWGFGISKCQIHRIALK